MIQKTLKKNRKQTAKVITTACLMLITIGVFSACNRTSNRTTESCEKFLPCIVYGEEINEYTIFYNVEKFPEFPGGIDALRKFIADNLIYPQEAQEKGIQGQVFCQFVIERDGSVSNIQVVRGIHPLLDEEAIRVIELMPKWIPGECYEEPVRVRFTLPIHFRFED